MDNIPEKLVEKTWREVAGFSPDRAGREMQKMAEDQPELLAFLMAMTEDLELEVSELAIYVAFVVYRIFQGASPRRKKLTSQEIIACYESNEAQMGNLEGADEKFIERVAGIQVSAQPHVIRYVVDALYEEEEGDSEGLTDEDRGFLFLLLKTIIDLLDKR